MTKKGIFKILKVSILISLVGFSCVLFIPRTYEVPKFIPRENIKFWDLKTGSKIAYSFLKGKGEQSLPPIIYLHGGPGGKVTQSTLEFFQALAEIGYDIYLYDQIGSGYSARLENIMDYSVQRHHEDLLEIMDVVTNEKVILFGHSWGSLLATDVYAEHPEKVEKMIFSGPGPILPINFSLGNSSPPDSLALIDPKFTNREGYQKANNLRNQLVFRWAIMFGRKLATDAEADQFQTFLNQELIKSTTCSGENTGIYEVGDGYYSHNMTAHSFYKVEDKRSKLKNNKCPLLLLKGQCDNQAWGFAQEYLDLFQNSQLEIIRGSGHQIEKDREAEYIEIISSFLGSNRAADSIIEVNSDFEIKNSN